MTVEKRYGGINSTNNYVMCMRCGKRVSNVLPVEIMVRAFVECPECIEAKGNCTGCNHLDRDACILGPGNHCTRRAADYYENRC